MFRNSGSRQPTSPLRVGLRALVPLFYVCCPQTPLYRKGSGYKDPSVAAAPFRPAAAPANSNAASWEASTEEKSMAFQRAEQGMGRQALLDVGGEDAGQVRANKLATATAGEEEQAGGGNDAGDDTYVDPQIIGGTADGEPNRPGVSEQSTAESKVKSRDPAEPANCVIDGSVRSVADSGVEVEPVAGVHATAIGRASTAPVGAGEEGTNGAPPVVSTSSPADGAGSPGGAGKDSSPKERAQASTATAATEVAAEAVLDTSKSSLSSARSSSSSPPASAPPAAMTEPAQPNGTVSSPQPVVEKVEPAPTSESALAEIPAAAAARPPRVETGTTISGWQRSPKASPSASRTRESGAKSPDAKARAAVSPKKGSAGIRSSSSSRKGGGPCPQGGSGGSAGGLVGAVSKEMEAAKGPRIKVPRAELLGAVVARLTVRRDLPDEVFAEIDEGFLSSEDDGSCDDMSESDGEEEEEAEDRQDRESTEAKDERRRRRRKSKSKRRGGEATVVREAVVSTFDETEGLYVLVNAHEEEEKLSLEELEVALHQSQVRPPPPPLHDVPHM